MVLQLESLPPWDDDNGEEDAETVGEENLMWTEDLQLHVAPFTAFKLLVMPVCWTEDFNTWMKKLEDTQFRCICT